jgi:hypothetical protein
MTLASDIAAVLTAAGYTNLRAYRFDSSTIPQICIIPGGGSADLVFSSDGSGSADIARPNIQIQVRDADLATAETRARAIIALLHRGTVANCISVTWDGRQPDYWTDENSLHIFSIEFRAIRTPGLT